MADAETSGLIRLMFQLNSMNMMKPKPIIMMGDTPFCNSLPEITSASKASIAPGNNSKPLSVGVKPNKRWAITGVRNIEVNIPIPVTKVNKADILSVRLFNTLRFTTGFATRSSHIIKETSEITATIVKMVMYGLANQSSVWPRSSTVCNAPIPTAKRIIPAQSMLAFVALISGSVNKK